MSSIPRRFTYFDGSPAEPPSWMILEHPWENDFREYARTLTGQTELPHSIIATRMFSMKNYLHAGKEDIARRLSEFIQDEGGPCYKCFEMLERQIAFREAQKTI